MDLEKFTEFRVAPTSGIDNPYKVQGKRPYLWIFSIWLDMKKNRHSVIQYTSYGNLESAKEGADKLALLAQEDVKKFEEKSNCTDYVVKVLNKKTNPEEFL